MGDLDMPEEMKEQLFRMLERDVIIRGEGYHCGHCAAFPCFRSPNREDPVNGAPCFQRIRRCRQECDLYAIREKLLENGEITLFPANGGNCRKTGRRVEYDQVCHVPAMRSRVRNNDFTEL